MAVWLKLRPKVQLDLPGFSIGFELPLPGPLPFDLPMSDRRFDRARELADETIAALRGGNLQRAVERLLALADEYPADQRAAAVRISYQARALTESADVLSEASRLERRDQLAGAILDAVATYREAADLAAGTGPVSRQAHEDAKLAAASATGRRHVRAAGGHADDDRVAVRCGNLGWQVDGRWILQGVDVELTSGSIVGVIGRNGAGKTTLLRLLAQDLRASRGSSTYPTLEAHGYRAERLDDRITYVPQIPTTYDGELEANLLMYAALRGLQGQALDDEAAYAIERFGLADLRHAWWSRLSGGFRTRVELARAMLASPDILILDEPLGPLDFVAQREYLQHLRDLAASRRDVCVILSSQDIHAIADVADYLIVIRDGALVFAGSPALIERELGARAYELSGRLTMSELKAALAGLPCLELRDDGASRLLITDATVTARQVLETLIAHGETIQYFRDLSRSAQHLLEDVGVGDRDADVAD